MSSARPLAPFVIAATGMLAEARIAERAGGVRAVAGGGDGAVLRRGLERQIAEGGLAIVSFGIAGGLAGDLGPGSIVVADQVMAGTENFATDAAWRQALARLIPDARIGAIAGSDTAVASVAAKAALHAQTRAQAVDMESHIAARVAAAHGLPFACLRVVADDATRALPPAALAGLAPGGSINVIAVLLALAGAPGQLPRLIRVSFDTRTAMSTLLRCHGLAGRGLGARL